ncbi:hypothetical protein C5Y96_12600 [Blastopirellula marina]|uniref:Uncharacterized protein n=1 Tax=Blastopirellula marina TaxID=124 RepID=A0A2S8FG90_9BACT|nr:MULTISPECIES: hypothetical protein [Pirellulaceae]PQO31183.1 hypothetical protein C5Y96_12600 [Blastopirellula marina]RCS51577.1 hypothetical protein DTL36_12610 [Bremerella cremea]
MEIVRPIAFGAVIIAGLMLLGCDVKFQRNSEHLHLRAPIYPNDPVSPGEESRRYDFEIVRANFGGIMLPNANGDGHDEHVDIGLKRLGYQQWELKLTRVRAFPEDDLRHDANAQVLRFSDREAIPYYGHLFRFTFDGQMVHVEECTEQFPAELLPSAESRILTMNESEATFYRQRLLHPNGTGDAEDFYETIHLAKIDNDPAGTRATIVRKRMVSREVDGNYEAKALEEPKEESIGVGATLMIDNQLVRVKQIVPPGEVEGAGVLVGWIELELVELSQVEMHRALR